MVIIPINQRMVERVEGRTILVPPAWYPRLWYGTAEERSNFEIIGDGTLIHCFDLDEDLTCCRNSCRTAFGGGVGIAEEVVG